MFVSSRLHKGHFWQQSMLVVGCSVFVSDDMFFPRFLVFVCGDVLVFVMNIVVIFAGDVMCAFVKFWYVVGSVFPGTVGAGELGVSDAYVTDGTFQPVFGMVVVCGKVDVSG